MKIYLYIGEVWKYGVSKNGVKRYNLWWYKDKNVIYVTQFKGNIGECMKKELEKIYAYPILPQNIKREIPLPRPPGNKVDN